MIVIGASLGGMKALRRVVQGLPASFPLPIAVVLHRHRDSDDLLVHLLQQECALPISEALDKEPICAGHLYVAPADYHLLVDPLGFSLSTDDPVQYARPSIDVLFESAADAFGSAVTGVVLTGANHDGAVGAARIQARGGTILIQDPATAESPVMPEAALEATGIHQVHSLEEIGEILLHLTSSPEASSR
jgi:two-component system chemotaxis response regulator CheB